MSEAPRVIHVRDLAAHPGAVYVGRPVSRRRLPGSPFANPFRIGKDGDRVTVIERYRAWLLAQPDLVERARRELRGKVLACWCAPRPCHADVLLEVANRE